MSMPWLYITTVDRMLSALESEAAESAGPLEEKFAASSGRWLGWFGVGIGVAMVGFDWITASSFNWTVALIGLAVGCLSWIVLVRPQASAHRDGLLLRNILRDIAIPWPRIDRCSVGQTLVVTTKEAERFHGLGVTRSARTQMRETYGTTSMLLGGRNITGKTLGDSGGPSVARGEWRGGTYTGYVESRIAGLASRSERGAERPERADPVVAWAPLPLLLLVVAGLAIVVALLV